jgi:DNA-binding NarL/FixJ family response regulator
MATALITMADEGKLVAPIRVAIIDDHPVVAQGIAGLLARQADLIMVGVAGSLAGAEVAGLTRVSSVDVLLLDVRLQRSSGLHLLADQPPGERALPAVIVLTAYDYPQYAEAALQLGAAGFVLKTAPVDELVDAIRRVAAGGLAFAVRPSSVRPLRLTAREQAVVRLVADGLSNEEIGTALHIGSKTVETHLSRLFERYGLASRAALAARAVQDGWLDVPADR